MSKVQTIRSCGTEKTNTLKIAFQLLKPKVGQPAVALNTAAQMSILVLSCSGARVETERKVMTTSKKSNNAIHNRHKTLLQLLWPGDYPSGCRPESYTLYSTAGMLFALASQI